MLPVKPVAFWSKSNFFFGKKISLKPCDAGVGLIIDLKLSRDYSEWWQALILQGFRCLLCSAGVCEYTGCLGGLCPGGFRGGCAVGTAGWDAALRASGSNSCCWAGCKPQLGVNHSILGGIGLVWVSGAGTAAWAGQERDFPIEISALLCKCKNWEWLVSGLCWEVGAEEPQGKLAEIMISVWSLWRCQSLRWALSCLCLSNCAAHILNVIKLSSTVLNQNLGFSVLCYNDEIQKWKVTVVYK